MRYSIIVVFTTSSGTVGNQKFLLPRPRPTAGQFNVITQKLSEQHGGTAVITNIIELASGSDPVAGEEML